MRSVTQYTKSSFMYLVSGDAGHLTTNILLGKVPEKKNAGRTENKNKQRVECKKTSGCYATRRHR